MKRPLVLACAIGLVVAATSAALLARAHSVSARTTSQALVIASAAMPAFSEEKWPFLMDQWGLGRAFHCDAAHCGVAVDVYVRPKIGFCNCTTGVSDDDELERVGDVELIGEKYKPASAGHPIAVAWMKGRSRPYDVAGRAAGTTLALAFNDRCDVIVATAVVPNGAAARIEPAVLAFLNSDTLMKWAKEQLGL
ncbi:MAG TPA: hypothetical protein VGG01_17255 [Xanthobacteraceae bacterium]|jgi:hypothetical protein